MRVVTFAHEDSHLIPQVTAPVFQFVSLSNPARTEVRDSEGNWLATFTDGARTVTVKGPQRTFVERDLPIFDEFTRTRTGTSGWGASTFGGNWSLTGGIDPNDYTVDGNVGRVTCGTANASRRMYLSPVIQNPDVKVRITTDKAAVGASQTPSVLFNYQDTSNHHLAVLDFVPSRITDGFGSNASGTWGSLDVGQAWTRSGGVSAEYAVVDGVARHTVPNDGSSRRNLTSRTADSDTYFKVRTDKLAVGQSISAALLVRYADSNNHYLFRVRFSSNTGKPVYASLQKEVAGVTTLVHEVQVGTLSHTIGTFYRVRAKVTGSQFQMKVWGDGGAEPVAWTFDITDTTFTGAGRLGLRSLVPSSYTGTSPVLFDYDDFSSQTDSEALELRLQKRVAGTTTTLDTQVELSNIARLPGSLFWLRVKVEGESIKAKVWADGTSEPTTWTKEVTDATFANGKVGLRASVDTGTANLPVTFGFDNFSADGTAVNPVVVQHDKWVRLLAAPYSGTMDAAAQTWLTDRLNDATPDALAIAMQYLPYAPPVIRDGLQIAGDAHYGPLLSTGTREEGSDFSDYLGISWRYSSTYTDVPEPGQFQSLDCSGFVRMVYGYRLGMHMTSSTMNGTSIPRVSSDIMNGGPGVLLRANDGTQPTDLSVLAPGDILGWDADTSNPDEQEGQLDHVGIYLGLDGNGNYRFLSARKSADGPMFSDMGGASLVNGSSLYGRTFRAIRRF